VTRSELWDVVKTIVVIVYGILVLLSTFGPLQQYWQWFGLAAGIVAIIAGSLGATLTRPTEQITSIKARKAGDQ